MARVVLYELNEVPWEIIDYYTDQRPQSHVARLVAQGECRTTHNGDPDHLSPWGTWPTFHTGLYRAAHNSHQLGQDPGTFRGVNFWDVADRAGRKVGLFGPLQSWPAKPFRSGGFYVPDTFARTPETIPASMSGFQRFNLSMTNELGFSADRKLSMADLASAGVGLLAHGMTATSAAQISRQLVRERRDSRFKAARSIMQALPAFDLFWRLQCKEKPDLSIFFTNHVAGMLHRFWGDTMPSYAAENDYEADPVFAGFILEAMDIFDRHLGRIMKYLEKFPDTVLVVAASMGQAPVPYSHIGETYVIEDVAALGKALDLGAVEEGMAMYPMYALEFPSSAAAERAASLLGLIEIDGHPLIDEINVYGDSVSYKVRAEVNKRELSHDLTYRTDPDGPVLNATLGEIGLGTAQRLGGGNTAYHIPDGVYVTFGQGAVANNSREVFDVREASTDVMALLGLEQEWADQRSA